MNFLNNNFVHLKIHLIYIKRNFPQEFENFLGYNFLCEF